MGLPQVLRCCVEDHRGLSERAAVLPVWEVRGECWVCRVVLPAYGAGPYLPAIVMERPVYVREMSDGLYSPLTYLMYKVGTPPALLQALCHAPFAVPLLGTWQG